MPTISIISHNQQLFSKVEKLLQYSDYQLGEIKGSNLLLILEPILITDEYFAISTFWQVWLEKFSPETKLITASFFEQENNPNHIDLIQFPKNFSAFEKQVKTASEMGEVPILGKDIYGKIRKFLDGHGEESLLKIITQLKSLLDTMLFLLMDEAELEQVLEATWQNYGDGQLSQLQKRMEEYQAYFQYLPLWEEYQNALTAIGKFEPNSEENIQQFTQTLSGWSDKLRQNFDLQTK